MQQRIVAERNSFWMGHECKKEETWVLEESMCFLRMFQMIIYGKSYDPHQCGLLIQAYDI
jgi:hypothetical protein